MVNLGENADSTGAAYGQLVGAFYGERCILSSWRYKLAHRLLIEYFAERLYHLGKTADWEKIFTFLPIFERPGFAFACKTPSPGYAITDPKTEFPTEIPYYVRESERAGPLFSARGAERIRRATSSGSSSCGKCRASGNKNSSEFGNRPWKWPKESKAPYGWKRPSASW